VDTLQAFRAHRADAAVVVAYGMILPQPILDAPRERGVSRVRSLWFTPLP